MPRLPTTARTVAARVGLTWERSRGFHWPIRQWFVITTATYGICSNNVNGPNGNWLIWASPAGNKDKAEIS